MVFSRCSMGFARLWIGNTASGLATWAFPFVLGLLVLERLLTAAELGVVLAVRTIGFLVAVPVSGVMSDRMGPRRMILLASLAAALGIEVFAGGLLAGRATGFACILAGAILVGIGQGACRPAYQAIVPRIVTRDRLQAANAAMTISVRVTTLVGPTIATGIALAFGGTVALSGVALLWVMSAVVPPLPAGYGAPLSAPGSTGRNIARQFVADLGEGIGEARRHPWFLAGLAALTCVIATGYSVTAVMLPELSDAYYGSAVLLTVSVTAYTLGALLGAVVIARWRPVNPGWTALVGLALYGLVPFSLLGPFPVVVPATAFFVAGVGIEIFNVPWFTSVQREVPSEKLSRVSSIDFLVSYGLAPLGLALLVPMATLWGREMVLLLCGLLCVAAPLLAALVPTARRFASVGMKG